MGHLGERDQRSPSAPQPCPYIAPFGYSGIPA